jgi:hypothetical protein
MITKIILTTIIALLFTSCNFNIKSITGSGNVKTENRNIAENFTAVDASDGVEVTIEQAQKTNVSVTADDNVLEHIKTSVENGVLIISCDYNSFSDFTARKVTVRMPVIEELEASSSALIESDSTVKCSEIELTSSSGSSINIQLQAENLKCKASSGSSIILSGLAMELDATSSSGSDISAFDLPTNTVVAKASSGSSISVSPILSLKARASSGSDITYSKTPKTIEKKESSGASIDLRSY